MEVTNEKRIGLVSFITFQCNMCGYTTEKNTENPINVKSKINYGAVWGTLSMGSTYSHLQGLLGAMDIPSLPYRIFQSIEVEAGVECQDSLLRSMADAGQEEKRLALEANQIDKDGIPWTTVYCDGGWSHRSYGYSYNASSGVAVIIGKLTGKLLFLAVRNKYCSICARINNKDQFPRDHLCYKNWNGSSGAMEASIIVEGFKDSIQTHGLKYLHYVGDGDSSVLSKIRTQVPYGNDVIKIECRNHAIKNYGKALYRVKSDTKVNVEARKLLTNTKIKALQDICTKIIYINAKFPDVEKLKDNLNNSLFHVFEDQSKCEEGYCLEVGQTGNSIMDKVKETGLYFHINSALLRLSAKGHHLVDNETSNRAELYMSILCKFNSGKRLNLTSRGSFQARCMLSGLRYNEGVEWQQKQWKKIMKCSPGKHFKKYLGTRKNELKKRSKRKLEFKQLKNKITISKAKQNVEYGPDASTAELSLIEYESEKSRLLKSLHVQQEEIVAIEQQTIGQWNNLFYKQIRKNRLTASQFGLVFKRRSTTSCEKLVKAIMALHSFDNEYIVYGKEKEDVARQKFIQLHPTKNVRACGIFIDPKYNYLAATPDGVVDENAVIEIKCLPKVHKSGKSLKEAATYFKNLPVEIVNGKAKLKRNHNYYYQVQGQLNICNKNMCYLIIYINDNEPLHVEIIEKDEELWKLMIEKLNQFYYNCLLPRLVDKNRKCLDKNHKSESDCDCSLLI